MRVLYISPFYYPSVGGVERFCHEIAIQTQKAGHEVHIVTQSIEGFKDYEVTENVAIHRIKPLLRFSKGLLMPRIKSKTEEISPDVVHIQGPAPGTADFINKRSNTKIIMTCHNDLSLTNSFLYKSAVTTYRKLVFPALVKKVDKIVMLSNAFRFFPKLLATVPVEKISIIPNGVDVNRYSPGVYNKEEYKSKLNIQSDFMGLFVGSMEKLHAYKGIEYLLGAARFLRETNTTFTLIGEGQLKPKYESLAKSFGINDIVKFIGKVDDDKLIDYYRAADFFLLPSISVEFMPLVMIEAFACGTPAIVTAIHGPREMIREGYNGYIAMPRNPMDIANKVKNIISDKNLLRKMQINSRNEAIEKYSWSKVLEMYMTLYQNIIS